MEEKPRRRDESIISKQMGIQILVMGIWLTILSFLFFKLSFFQELFGSTKEALSDEHLTAYFVLFIASALFNGFNVRDDGFGIFRGLNENTGFLKVFFTILIVQAVIVNAGLIPLEAFKFIGNMFSCVPFGVTGWIVVFVLGATMIPVDLIRKSVMKQK